MSSIYASPQPATINGHHINGHVKEPHETASEQLAKRLKRGAYRSFKAGDAVSARCSEGVAYRGRITAVSPNIHEHLAIRFDDGDECEVRRSDVRHQLHTNEPGTINFPTIAGLTSPHIDPKPTKCVDCGQPCISSKLPQYCIKSPNSSNCRILTCFMCGDTYHKACYRSQVVEYDSDMRNKLKYLTRDEQVVLGWKCRFCVVQLFTELTWRGPGDKSGRAVPQYLRNEFTIVTSSLDYDPKYLKWAKHQKSNSNEIYCYCGATGDWWYKMVQCSGCRQWFHENCLHKLKETQTGKLLCGDRFFILYCGVCREDGEWIARVAMTLLEAVHLILYNVQLLNNHQGEEACAGSSSDLNFIDWDLTAEMTDSYKSAKQFIWPHILRVLDTLPIPKKFMTNNGKMRDYILEEILKKNRHIFMSCSDSNNKNDSIYTNPHVNTHFQRNAWCLKNADKTPAPTAQVLTSTLLQLQATGLLGTPKAVTRSPQKQLNGHRPAINGHARHPSPKKQNHTPQKPAAHQQQPKRTTPLAKVAKPIATRSPSKRTSPEKPNRMTSPEKRPTPDKSRISSPEKAKKDYKPILDSTTVTSTVTRASPSGKRPREAVSKSDAADAMEMPEKKSRLSTPGKAERKVEKNLAKSGALDGGEVPGVKRGPGRPRDSEKQVVPAVSSRPRRSIKSKPETNRRVSSRRGSNASKQSLLVSGQTESERPSRRRSRAPSTATSESTVTGIPCKPDTAVIFNEEPTVKPQRKASIDTISVTSTATNSPEKKSKARELIRTPNSLMRKANPDWFDRLEMEVDQELKNISTGQVTLHKWAFSGSNENPSYQRLWTQKFPPVRLLPESIVDKNAGTEIDEDNQVRATIL